MEVSSEAFSNSMAECLKTSYKYQTQISRSFWPRFIRDQLLSRQAVATSPEERLARTLPSVLKGQASSGQFCIFASVGLQLVPEGAATGLVSDSSSMTNNQSHWDSASISSNTGHNS